MFKHILAESINKVLLTENRRSTAKHKTIEYLAQLYGQEKAVGLENALMDKFFHGRRKDGQIMRLEPLVASLYYSKDVQQSEQNQILLARILDYLYELELEGQQLSSIPCNAGDMDFASFRKKFESKMISYYNNKRNEALDQDLTGESDYEIVPIGTDFKLAKKYGEWTGKEGDGSLCYTDSENTFFDSFNAGYNKLYLLLGPSWKYIEYQDYCDESGENYVENHPYDEYGLSMVWVFISPEGDIANSNTRWNHWGDKGNVDHRIDEKLLNKLLCCDYRQVLVPYTKEELRKNGFSSVNHNEVFDLLKRGEPLENIFDYVTTKQIRDEEFYIGTLRHKALWMQYNKQTGLIEPFVNDFFDYTTLVNPSHSLLMVTINHLSNVLDLQEKRYLFDEWYAQLGFLGSAFDVQGFAARRENNGKYACISYPSCRILTDFEFDTIESIMDSTTYVKCVKVDAFETNWCCYLLNLETGELSESFWSIVGTQQGPLLVSKKISNNGCVRNLVYNGGFLLDKWYTYVQDGKFCIQCFDDIKDQYKVVVTNKLELLPFKVKVKYFSSEECLLLREGDKVNLLDTDGDLFFKQWVDSVCEKVNCIVATVGDMQYFYDIDSKALVFKGSNIQVGIQDDYIFLFNPQNEAKPVLNVISPDNFLLLETGAYTFQEALDMINHR